MAAPATAVLVHGACHGAGYWDAVVRGLVARGVRALAPDLPGHGGDRRPPADLHGDADSVRAVLDSVDGPVVLVGHSYGGAVITEAGVHPAVTHLVFITALPLRSDESTARAGGAEAAGLDLSDRPGLRAALTVTDGIGVVDPARAGAVLWSDLSPATAADAARHLCPQRMANLFESPAAEAWRSVDSTYAVCAEDNTIHPELQRLLARRTGRTVTWPTGHFPMLSRPELVVDLIAEVAGRG